MNPAIDTSLIQRSAGGDRVSVQFSVDGTNWVDWIETTATEARSWYALASTPLSWRAVPKK